MQPCLYHCVLYTCIYVCKFKIYCMRVCAQLHLYLSGVNILSLNLLGSDTVLSNIRRPFTLATTVLMTVVF